MEKAYHSSFYINVSLRIGFRDSSSEASTNIEDVSLHWGVKKKGKVNVIFGLHSNNAWKAQNTSFQWTD